MRVLLISFLLLLSSFTFGQDTIVKKDGTVLAVKILEINKEYNVMVYEYQGKRITTTISSLQSYVLHSEIEEKEENIEPIIVEDKPIAKYQRRMKYIYGPWSVSSNISALIPTFRFNSRLTIEPEYELTPRFSIKTPFVIGVSKTHKINVQPVNSSFHKGMLVYYKYGSQVPGAPQLYFDPHRQTSTRDILLQAGINPKFYLNKKSKNIVSLYAAVALNLGLADAYCLTRFDHFDTVKQSPNAYQSPYYSTSGSTYYIETELSYENNKFNYFNYELLLGLDFNISKSVGVTLEAGCASRMYANVNLKKDRLYTAFYDQDYILTYEGLDNFWDNNLFFRSRILLTYRFGGKLRE
jgi:hypothetical protein